MTHSVNSCDFIFITCCYEYTCFCAAACSFIAICLHLREPKSNLRGVFLEPNVIFTGGTTANDENKDPQERKPEKISLEPVQPVVPSKGLQRRMQVRAVGLLLGPYYLLSILLVASSESQSCRFHTSRCCSSDAACFSCWIDLLFVLLHTI